LWVSVILGLGLLAAYVFRSPLIFDNFDELNHGATLTRLLDSRALFQPNPILPVCPFYPGIELVTIATRWLTGLPLLLDQMVILVVARIVTVLCVFLIVERACNSARAGGVGLLVYTANPEFYSLGAQYGYQTLALTFAVAVVYLLFVSIDAAQPKRGRLFALALISIAGMVVSHHVTAWLTVGFLVVWAAGLRFIIDPGRSAPAATAGQIPATAGLARSQAGIASRDEEFARRKERRKAQSRIVGLAALVGVVLVGLWIAFLGRVLTGYIYPIVQEAASSAAAMLGHLHGDRKLFQNSAGGGTPFFVTALILASAVFFSLIILISLYAVVWKKTVRGGRLRYLPAAIAATYPLAMLSNLSSAAKEVGSRTTTFIFFGVAVVVGGWLAGRLLRQRRVIERMATIGVAIICFLGSTLYGGGPLPLFVNGPYIVGAHERSLGSPSLALANWVSTHLPEGAHVAADRDNAGLLGDFGQIYPVSPLNGSASPARLFFDRKLTPSDISLIRKDDIRYIVTDTRLTEALPLFGAYIAPSETERPTRLTAAELEKFNSIRGVYRIYDNGAIQVYDLSQLLGERPLVVPRHSVRSIRATGTDVVVLVLAILVAAVWLWRLRRRARLVPIDEHMVVCALVGALAIGLFGTFAILLFHLTPSPIAILCLLVLLALGVRPPWWRTYPWRDSRRRAASPPTPLESAPEPHIASSVTTAAGGEMTGSDGSSQKILADGNAVASRNGSRTPKRLWSDAGDGPPIVGYVADSEHDEAAFVAEEVDRLTDEGEATPGQVAVFYRTDAQSRVFEEVFIQAGLPYKVVGGVRFYERREVRDLLAYLRLIANPDDEVSLRRILNVPRRGIGARAEACVATVAKWDRQSFAAALARPAEVPGLAPRSVRSIEAFNELIDGLRADGAAGLPVAELAEAVLERSGYLAELQASEEPQDARRIENLNELIAAARGFDATGGAAARRDPETGEGAPSEGPLADFLKQLSLVTDADQVLDGEDHGGVVTLVTLDRAKGLEFPVVFLTGLEENAFPHQRSADDDQELEEEQRLAYVGITRAERRLYLTRALARTWWERPEYHGQPRFLAEVPESLVERRSYENEAGAAAAPASQQPDVRSSGDRRAPADKVNYDARGPGTVMSEQGFAEDPAARIDSGGGPVLESAGRPSGRPHRARSQFVLGCAGLALFAVGATFAVAAAQKQWVPPPELSIEARQGEPVASVDLGTAAPIPAHVAVVTRGRVLWSVPLSSTSGTQNVVLPVDVLHPGSHVLLIAGGRTIRNVYG
jgi:hypothetical protein